MSIGLREGRLDVVVAAGPRIDHWSTVGGRTICMLCAESGRTAGLYGGDQMTVRGVIPLPQTGGLVIVEDGQHRIHRIRARAVVRLSAPAMSPDPFPGWWSEGLVPLPTAQRLRREGQISWAPATVILGTGNRALAFGADLLDSGAREVHCIESSGQWEAKRFAGWEVARRRFEIAGGRIHEARPVRLSKKAALLWELRLEDSQGIRLIEVARVVSAGPFRPEPGSREYPPGSLLFDLEQTAAATRAEDVDGWALEEERSRLLAAKIIRSLASELGPAREALERAQKKAKSRLKRYLAHRARPFTPSYQGKWIVPGDLRAIREFTGVPRAAQKSRLLASVECFESISCNLCEAACPEDAIDFSGDRKRVLDEAKCTGCGACLPACPSSAPVLIQERENLSMSRLTLSWRPSAKWKEAELATLANRRGEPLGSGRVISTRDLGGVQLVEVEVPTHLVWEARGLSRRTPETAAEPLPMEPAAIPRVPITFDGEKRLVRSDVPISLALFETGHSRAQDALYCPDGSCGLCEIEVDGNLKLACRSETHAKMSIRLRDLAEAAPPGDLLCPCLGITREQVVERIRQGRLRSPEAVVSVTRLGCGKCHGQLCREAFQRVLEEHGIDASGWVDWRFPWSEWILVPGSGS